MKKRQTGRLLLIVGVLALFILAGCAGEFKKVKDTLTTGSTEGEDHGIAVIYCEYTKENVRFRVAFDPDMNLIGLEIGQN